MKQEMAHANDRERGDVVVEAAYARGARVVLDGRAWVVLAVEVVEEGDSAFLLRHARLSLRDLLSGDSWALTVHATEDLPLAPPPRPLVVSHRAGRDDLVLRDPETHEELTVAGGGRLRPSLREGDAVSAIVVSERVVGFVDE